MELAEIKRQLEHLKTYPTAITHCNGVDVAYFIPAQIAELVAAVESLTAEKEREIALQWIKGEPPYPYGDEWFIARTIHRERVVLRSLPKEYSYDYTTADGTYMKRENITDWMQFPDSQYKSFALTTAEYSLARAREEIEKLKEHVSDLKDDIGIANAAIEGRDAMIQAAEQREKGLVEALEKLARLGNEPYLGNSDGNMIAQAALAAASTGGDKNA